MFSALSRTSSIQKIAFFYRLAFTVWYNRYNILFIYDQNATATADDVWDDTALIKAYDKAVNLAKSEVVKRMGMEIETVEEKLSEEQNHNKQHRVSMK